MTAYITILFVNPDPLPLPVQLHNSSVRHQLQLKRKTNIQPNRFFSANSRKKEKKKDEIVSERSKANCPSCRQRPEILDRGGHEEAGHYGGCRGRIWPLYCSGRVSDSSQTFQFGRGVSGLDTTLRLLGNHLG